MTIINILLFSAILTEVPVYEENLQSSGKTNLSILQNTIYFSGSKAYFIALHHSEDSLQTQDSEGNSIINENDTFEYFLGTFDFVEKSLQIIPLFKVRTTASNEHYQTNLYWFKIIALQDGWVYLSVGEILTVG